MVSSLIAPLLAACLFFLFPASVVPTAIVDLDITLTGNSTDEPFLQRRRGGPWDRNCAGSGNCDGLRKNDGGANWCIRAMSGYKSDRRYNRYSSSIFQGTEDEHGGGCTLMFNCQDSAEFDRGVMGAEIMETCGGDPKVAIRAALDEYRLQSPVP
ncbi:MAG: hypothetical protein M1833_006298 [Piccolia ochrophora]|nr:MAG: hypothetical protein M1833_006298 [Piccolia ochrophora]